MNKLLNKIKQQITVISTLINQDKYRQQTAFFDPHLFISATSPQYYRTYLDEVNQNFLSLTSAVEKNQAEKAEFLSEKLINQISALTRALANDHRVTNEIITQETESLSQKYARHLDYLRRLQTMKYEIEYQIKQAPSSQKKQQLDQENARLDSRINRCQKAITELEIILEKHTES